MKVYLDDDGYVYLHAEDYEDIPEGYKQVDDEKVDREHFLQHRNCYKWEDDKLVYHSERENAVDMRMKQGDIRQKRSAICFPIINRGQLWYESLTDEQRHELRSWYQAWLDAPEMLTEPEMPKWLEGR